MALGCHWPSMSLIGDFGSRGSTHLVCGDDGLDVGDEESHIHASLFRSAAGFERHPGKEIHSFTGALIKEVPMRRDAKGWRVLKPLKVRVISGDGQADEDAPRFVSDFWALSAEVVRQDLPDPLYKKAEAFLLRRYSRPLSRVAAWGATVPVLGTRKPERAWRLRVQTAEGSRDPLLVPAGKGGSRALSSLIEERIREVVEWPDGYSTVWAPPTRETVGDLLCFEQFSDPWLEPGRSGGAESLADLLSRLGRQMAPPSGPKFLDRVGPRTVSEFAGAEERVYPTTGVWVSDDPWSRWLS